ncbi:MAG: hypothetical protein A2Y62_13465 [Candidatus Fischerbacteria bacterium RBG_13_37_8]|uniref:Uncharacterized protein n=1 Tax=Candidatus Fischerbacteria bacterium RBG_13_37_8 TaxID=1817863 RepID=A0A1F5VLX5_9BACT|nr:MAG: hypothetical protein A2Y62_13465 [Candidatus Fischerbacteria bacterium RBG_13_37_8]
MSCALFFCVRDELRAQGLGAFQKVFGADVAEVTSANPRINARILVAIYKILNDAEEQEDAIYFLENYSENYFSHIIIDESYRNKGISLLKLLNEHSIRQEVYSSSNKKLFLQSRHSKNAGRISVYSSSKNTFGGS